MRILDALGMNCDEIGGARNVNWFFIALISNWEAFDFLLYYFLGYIDMINFH